MSQMNGILCIDKPEDFTSFDVVAKSRGILKTRKIGHGGTLDPMATGVLPLFIGRATKACDLLPDQDKRYRAELLLGVVTDTQDSTGTVLHKREVNVSPAEVEQALREFTGPQKQIPPMYSAIRIGGRRLYDLARQGVEVERAPRDIIIHEIKLLNTDGKASYTLDVRCSKGTYIRALCHDIGERLGCGGIMSSLRRTAACGYSIDMCVTLTQAAALAESGALAERILPVESAFQSYPRLDLDGRQERLFSNGVRLSLEEFADIAPDDSGAVRIFGSDERFLALGKADHESGLLVMKKWFGD